MSKEAIIKILKQAFSSVYCDTCEGNLEADYCQECYRKAMMWGISDDFASSIADKILSEGADDECI